MLLSSDDKKPKQPDLPLDTPEQIKHSLEVDDALERRIRREAEEVALRDADFQLLAKKIVFVAGLAMFVAAWLLWAGGENHFLAFGVGSGGVSAMAVSVKQLAKALGGS